MSPLTPTDLTAANLTAADLTAANLTAADLTAANLTAKDLSVALDRAPVLTGVDLAVPAGRWLAVVGPNGAGKSTLLRALAGLLPHDGEIAVGGTAVRHMQPRRRARLMAYAPQNPALPAEMSVFDYTLLGRTPYIPYLGRESRRDRDITGSVLERLDLASFAGRSLGRLSGGERQRVVLARALVQRARVLLLDEPTTALDLGHQQQVLELVDRLRLADGLTVVTTLHDLTVAASYADAMLLLSAGRAVASGTPAEVLTEAHIGTHFHARVAVTTDGGGRPVVTLLRPSGGDR
ncbi:iron complex transport system ATP-binding protein [Sinosporangium album]|uniref:Iron complex transport system ATP-binding protein n=1 Tax=Sinosporangium album TaxID=504805 RepID=A0A1G7SDZ7_9ACTN|nr:ABC transporter ATP-binding protein [Sinosporangium album]SDG21112.1 iron complex transport system ATP-binding protein [Sinosporangium album]